MPATKEQIADVFERHVARFGYQKATVEDVAAELGISKKTIYEYFDSKAAMYDYIVDRVAASSRAQLEAAIAGESLYACKVRALVAIMLRMSREHILETEESEWMQEYEIVGEALTRANGELLGELVAEGLQAGEFCFPDPELAVELLTGVVVRYVLMVREDPTIDRDDALTDAVVRFLG